MQVRSMQLRHILQELENSEERKRFRAAAGEASLCQDFQDCPNVGSAN